MARRTDGLPSLTPWLIAIVAPLRSDRGSDAPQREPPQRPITAKPRHQLGDDQLRLPLTACAVCNETGVERSTDVATEEAADLLGDQVAVLLEGEVAGIQEVELGVW